MTTDDTGIRPIEQKQLLQVDAFRSLTVEDLDHAKIDAFQDREKANFSEEEMAKAIVWRGSYFGIKINYVVMTVNVMDNIPFFSGLMYGDVILVDSSKIVNGYYTISCLANKRNLEWYFNPSFTSKGKYVLIP